MNTLTGATVRSQRESIGLSQAKLAELSGLPQHQISAFELGKIGLPPRLLDMIARAFADESEAKALSSRAKRYRNHEYHSVLHLPERSARAFRTEGNQAYLSCLDELGLRHVRNTGQGPTAVSLFSGCGGFSLGFSAAGFAVRGHLEVNEGARTIYELNFPASRPLGTDIESIDQARVHTIAKELGPIDVLIGGPPCQGFSLSGKRRVGDHRNSLFKHYLRWVDALRPKVAILENVRLLTSMRNQSGGLVKDDILHSFQSHGYKVGMFEVNAKDFGVPQHRERVIFLAVRADRDVDPSLPAPSHGEAVDLFGNTSPIRTFGDAVSDLPYLESGDTSPNDVLHQAVRHPSHVIDWLWDVPEGKSAHENADASKRPPSGYNTTYKRQVWSEPGATVQTTFGMISGCRNVHPVATRSLTIREAARIQSFPDSFRFSGSLGAMRCGIGNAVPPLLAFQLAQHTRLRLL